MRKQKEEKVHAFARVLGKRPRIGSCSACRYKTVDQLGLFVETFGPPEVKKRKSDSVLFWNFVRDDGQGNFSLVSHVPEIGKPTASIGRREVEVHLVADSKVKSFWAWTGYRLGIVEQGAEPPAFIGCAHFKVAPM
jgi:hypothetical protein